ncbi:hypothetical protein [Actibacterium sp. D379-3]
MALIADILLVAGALGAAFYCMVLSRRLRRLNDLETGMGGAIAVLSAQVDDMTRALESARSSARSSSSTLEDLTGRADGVAQRLELLVASLHDLPLPEEKPPAARPPQRDAVDPSPARPERPQAVGLSFIRSSQATRKEPPLVLQNRPEAAE